MADLFAQIKALLAPYAKHFSVYVDTADQYDLEEELPHNRTMFAFVLRRPKEVRFSFYPLNIWPELRNSLPVSLQSKITGKWTLKLANLAAADKKAVVKMIGTAWARIAAVRRLSPSHPYHRKFNLDDTHALIAQLASHAPARSLRTPTSMAQVERRKADIQVTLSPPPKKLTRELAARVAKAGVLRFKTITLDEYAALARVLGTHASAMFPTALG